MCPCRCRVRWPRGTGAILAYNQARILQAGQNRRALLSVGYQREDGCRGRSELREHTGHLFARLHLRAVTWAPTTSRDRICPAHEFGGAATVPACI
jgi:hypothetical protein